MASISSSMALMPSLLKSTNNFMIYNKSGVIFTRKVSTKMRFVVRNVADNESGTTATASDENEEKWEGEGEDSPMEMPKGPPSIISTLNVQKALRGIAITDVDHYARLGLRRGCSYDQVRAAYGKKLEELSSQGLEEENFNTEAELLKESYNILSSEEERRLYDWSLARNEAPERFTWPFETDITQKPNFGTPPPQEPENVGPTIAVGYFTLGWLVLAFTLSIILNR
ncbi:unnamed protein product [Amaranthus hypochondriacus]